MVKLVKLVAEPSTDGEKQGIHVLRQAEVGFEQAEVIGHATQNHVALEQGIVVPAEPSAVEILLAFVERERGDIDLPRDAVVQPALVGNELVGHP